MRSSLQAQEVTKFKATDEYSKFGLAKVQYSVRSLCGDEQERVTELTPIV
jgi:hypothetical protein